MADFYINKNEQKTGEHEVHKNGCLYLLLMTSKEYLGSHTSSHSAILKVMSLHPLWIIDGCATCCPESHTR